MPHLNTGQNEYDLTVSAFIFREEDGDMKLLLHMHKKLKQWLMVGGHIERDENIWQALVHEVSEESGYTMTELQVLQPVVHSIDFVENVQHPTPVLVLSHHMAGEAHYHNDFAYAFLATDEPRGEVGLDESQSLRWFTRTEVAAIDAREIDEDFRKECAVVFDMLPQLTPLSVPKLSTRQPKTK